MCGVAMALASGAAQRLTGRASGSLASAERLDMRFAMAAKGRQLLGRSGVHIARHGSAAGASSRQGSGARPTPCLRRA
jgi:hypothetical protein